MDYAALFESNLEIIDRVIAGVCRRAGVYGADAEDFASTAKLTLMENDFAVLRPYQGRSSLSTFLLIVIHRLLIDERTKRTGRWHASREAERLGEAGLVLERIVRREHRSIDEALPFMQAIDPAITRERAVEMEARLPLRASRPRPIDLETAGEQLVSSDCADERAIAAQAGELSQRVEGVIRDALERMPVEDRMIIRFHFGSSMTIAEISGLLRLPQRPLYRRMESLLRRLRAALDAEAIVADDIRDVLGSATREIDFGLRDGKSDPHRQTNPGETTVGEAG